jgi:hypothetical protein
MLIHSYLTDGFFEMAKVFLQSLDQVSKPSHPPVWLDTRNLTTYQISELYDLYPGGLLHIQNRMLPVREWANQLGISVKQLKQYKQQCESRFVSQRNKAWKLLTAGDDRVAAFYSVLFGDTPPPDNLDWGQMGINYIAHFDIDTLFRKPLGPTVPKLMEEADIWLKLRPGHPTLKARITIDCILVRPTDGVRRFFDEWRRQINRVEPKKRPVGFGQASCWFAFQKIKDYKRFNYKTLPLEFGLPGRNKKDQIIWCGNVHKLAKDDCVKLFKKEAGIK